MLLEEPCLVKKGLKMVITTTKYPLKILYEPFILANAIKPILSPEKIPKEALTSTLWLEVLRRSLEMDSRNILSKGTVKYNFSE